MTKPTYLIHDQSAEFLLFIDDLEVSHEGRPAERLGRCVHESRAGVAGCKVLRDLLTGTSERKWGRGAQGTGKTEAKRHTISFSRYVDSEVSMKTGTLRLRRYSTSIRERWSVMFFCHVGTDIRFFMRASTMTESVRETNSWSGIQGTAPTEQRGNDDSYAVFLGTCGDLKADALMARGSKTNHKEAVRVK
jgi:hypothetical protein